GGEIVGSLTVSAPESLLTYRLPTILSWLRRQHPRVNVELRPSTIGRFRGDVRRALADGTVDVALVRDTTVRVQGFRSAALVQEQISVIGAPLDPLASARLVQPKDLDDAVVLLPEAPDSGCVYRAQFERQLAEGHVTPRTSLEFASIEAVKQCVVAGMGVSVLPSVAVEADVLAGRLVLLPWRGRFEAVTQLVWNNRRAMSPAVGAFLDAARAAFSNAPTTSGAARRRSG